MKSKTLRFLFISISALYLLSPNAAFGKRCEIPKETKIPTKLYSMFEEFGEDVITVKVESDIYAYSYNFLGISTKKELAIPKGSWLKGTYHIILDDIFIEFGGLIYENGGMVPLHAIGYIKPKKSMAYTRPDGEILLITVGKNIEFTTEKDVKKIMVEKIEINASLVEGFCCEEWGCSTCF